MMNLLDKGISIIIEESFDISREILWKVITDKKHMAKWFFEQIFEFKPEAGFKTKFIVENEGRIFPHCWEVLEVVPEEKISLGWKYDEYDGSAVAEFILTEENNKSHLKLVFTILEKFDDNIPEFTYESCLGGWNYFIKESLKNYIEIR